MVATNRLLIGYSVYKTYYVFERTHVVRATIVAFVFNKTLFINFGAKELLMSTSISVGIGSLLVSPLFSYSLVSLPFLFDP